MDDLTVGDPAPGPSLAHSTLDGAVVVVGNQLQAADPRGSYHPIIRDSLDHPLSGVSVSIAFPGHEYDTYFPSHGPNYSGPPAMYCNPPKFTQVTGANGEAHFTILGRRIGPDLSAVAIVSVNGSPWVTRPLAFVDIDGSGEDGNGQAITGSDFSFFQADFFSGQYRARADYNGNGVLDGNDYSDFLDYFFGGYVQGGNAFGFCTDINPKPPVAPALAIPAIPTFKRDGYYDVAGHRLDRPPTIPGLYWQVENGMPRKLRVR